MVGKAYRLYKGPIYLKFTYTVVYIYTYIYTFTNNVDKATDPELSLPNPVSFPDDRNRLFKTKGSNHPAICLSPPDPFYPNPSQKDPDSKHWTKKKMYNSVEKYFMLDIVVVQTIKKSSKL